ncbi:tyrosinase family protein [Variovorax sp. DT-64]|uniref:tyrosinase family protein n=1 Tax=Variovorax sp. DT-64 TaxID=3396160 RepID=UPI003F1A83CC
MTLSRRNFLETGALAALGYTAFPEPAAAQATPVRRSIGQLGLADPAVQTMREGVRLLKTKPVSDPLNWSNLADIHLNFCPHGNWFFLPWHRAYLVMYERLIRSVTGNPQFALPYWDWTADRQLPAAFAQSTFNGQPNPLFEPSRSIPPTLSLPDNMVGPSVISGILGQTAFEIFASSRPSGQNSTAQSWQRANGSQGPMESNPHNRLHTTVGGIMSGFRSPIDPIFLMHHGNIDRLWAMWIRRCRRNTTSTLWTQFNFVNNFRRTNGTTYSVRVSSLLSTTSNGYNYPPTQAVPCRAAPLANLALRDPLPRAAARLSPGSRLNTRTFRTAVDVGRTAAPMQVLEVQVSLQGRPLRTLSAVRASASASASADEMPRAAAPGQVLAFIDDVPTPPNNATDVRVFLNCDYLNADTPTSDPHYVGTFSFFGRANEHAGHAGHLTADGKVSFTLDLTPALQALGRAQQLSGDTLRLQLLPVPAPGRPADQVAPITPGRVEIALL